MSLFACGLHNLHVWFQRVLHIAIRGTRTVSVLMTCNQNMVLVRARLFFILDGDADDLKRRIATRVKRSPVITLVQLRIAWQCKHLLFQTRNLDSVCNTVIDRMLMPCIFTRITHDDDWCSAMIEDTKASDKNMGGISMQTAHYNVITYAPMHMHDHPMQVMCLQCHA